MVTLYVTSSPGNMGKTAICAGLGQHLLNEGHRIGFLKPVLADKTADGDGAFMKHVLALEETIDSICPVINNQNNLANSVKQACDQVSRGKDVVVIEGMPIEASYEAVEALDAKVLIVEGYSKELPGAKLIDGYQKFEEHLLGVVINKVPSSKLEQVHNEASAQLGEAGINVLGVLPEDRALLALTIGELAEHLQGKILNNNEKLAELVENFMLGAMVVDPGPDYFGRKDNKAVIVRSNRPDMQLAALETSTKCLILSGDTAPIPSVLYQAEAKKVPIILTSSDATATVKTIEDALSQTRFNQEKKLPRLTDMIKQYFNFPALYQGLGLAG